jgi:hypothetical protein
LEKEFIGDFSPKGFSSTDILWQHRKAFPNANGIQGVVVRPIRIRPYKLAE